MFNILRDPIIRAIPWEAIAPHEAQAKANHGQTLKGLHGRGGLSIHEAYWIMKDKPFPRDFKRSERNDAAYRVSLLRLVQEFEINKGDCTAETGGGDE